MAMRRGAKKDFGEVINRPRGGEEGGKDGLGVFGGGGVWEDRTCTGVLLFVFLDHWKKFIFGWGMVAWVSNYHSLATFPSPIHPYKSPPPFPQKSPFSPPLKSISFTKPPFFHGKGSRLGFSW